jgi:hypothetical protein
MMDGVYQLNRDVREMNVKIQRNISIFTDISRSDHALAFESIYIYIYIYIYSSKGLINVDITVARSTLMNKLVKKEKNMKWRSVFKCL